MSAFVRWQFVKWRRYYQRVSDRSIPRSRRWSPLLLSFAVDAVQPAEETFPEAESSCWNQALFVLEVVVVVVVVAASFDAALVVLQC